MKKAGIALLLLGVYLLLLPRFVGYMEERPVVEKLGYVPEATVLKAFSGNQRLLVAEGLVFKVLVYFGSILEKSERKIDIPPEYYNIYKTLEAAVFLDPYNMDSYYFAQAVLVWDVNRIKEVNRLLEHGMKYRDWDFMLPFFAGFNYAYFLKNYAEAARFYRRAGELTGAELYVSLTGRYLYEANQTELAISYLTAMEKSAKNDAIRKSFRRRISAFKAISRIENAVGEFRRLQGKNPRTVDELVAGGILSEAPEDPYGGKFYITADGRVRSTSNFYEGVQAGK